MASKFRISIDTEFNQYINFPGSCARNLDESYTTMAWPMRPLIKDKERTTPFSSQQIEKIMFPPTINQRSGWSDNTSTNFRIAINTDTKISHKKISNCQITTDDINIKESIYDTHIPIIQGKAIRRNTDNQKNHPKDTLTPYNGQAQPQYGSSHGFLFLYGSPLLHTKSRNIYFRSVQACNIRGNTKLCQVKNKWRLNINIGDSPPLTSMGTINLDTFNIFSTGPYIHMLQ